MQKFVIGALAAALLSTAGAASAQDVRIPYGDLNIGSAQGAAALDARIADAADRACRMGAPLPDAQCRARFRVDALRRLPSASRQDYVRARGVRVMAMTPTYFG